ncbi:hypothetical protein INT45_008246 [Circinella minor]|uniref:CENP-V/GFA domain-containing protein n=1 Tax=Circinella minor TaxID=1195481 RepID=A0A8H7S5E6_9FUNG|nr:hypothetical protein INT45_008246 [Circinella minor]
MSESLSGTCLCGSIKVKLNSTANHVGLCYCSDCQKSAGGPYQCNAMFNSSDVELEDPKGYVKLYVVPKEQTLSGIEKQKWFCGNCGSPLFVRPMSLNGEKSFIKTGILDTAPGFQGTSPLDQLKPTSEIFTKNRPSYVKPIDDAAQFNTVP